MPEIGDINRTRSRQLSEEHPWIWLYEVEVPTDPATRYRLTNFDRDVQYGQSSAGVPLIFTPAGIVHGDMQETKKGDLPQMQVQIANDGFLMRDILELYDGLIGQPCTIRLLNMLEIPAGTAAMRFDGEIASCNAKLDRVTWNVSALSLSQIVTPGERYLRGHCPFRYGSPECGYDLTNASLAAAFPSCDHTLTACGDHGAAELSILGVSFHPERFGGWPSLPRAIQTATSGL